MSINNVADDYDIHGVILMKENKRMEGHQHTDFTPGSIMNLLRVHILVLPLFEEVHHSFEVINAILSLHVHQDAVRGRLHRNMKEGIDAWMIQYFSHLLTRYTEERPN